MAQDPVCKMEVDEKTTEYQVEYKNKVYYFCTQLCLLTFQNKPEKFLQNDESDESSEKASSN